METRMGIKTIKQIFHTLSYQQYPLYLIALVFAIKPYINGIDYVIEHIDILITNLNYFFIFLGLGISFASLQDIKKIHTKFEKKVIEDPKKAKILLLITSISTALMLVFGVLGYFLIENKYVNEISLGILILGIGFIGVIKLQLELIELNIKNLTLNKANVKPINAS